MMVSKVRHTVPVGNVLVCDTGRHVKHDDTAVAVDIITVAKTAELFLAGGIPDIELDGAQVLRLSAYCQRWWGSGGIRTVVKPRGWTSTPRVAMYFFSNSPVKWRFTKVV
jgi:hypothetical protein